MEVTKTRKTILFSFIFITVVALIFISNTADIFANSSEIRPDNGIPVVYINIDETQGTVQDMIESPNHSVYCYGTISIAVPEGFHYSDFPDSVCESITDLSMSIRGRGNSTWMKSMKKPFKIKLDKKADIV